MKKSIALALALILLATTFVGCVGNQNTQVVNNTTASESLVHSTDYLEFFALVEEHNIAVQALISSFAESPEITQEFLDGTRKIKKLQDEMLISLMLSSHVETSERNAMFVAFWQSVEQFGFLSDDPYFHLDYANPPKNIAPYSWSYEGGLYVLNMQSAEVVWSQNVLEQFQSDGVKKFCVQDASQEAYIFLKTLDSLRMFVIKAKTKY